MGKVRVLILGAAFSADLHADGYARIRDKAEIVGIADKDQSRIKALAERYGFTGYKAYEDYKDAIEDCECDLVDICLPNFLHYDPALLAIEKGRNIISEKPLATTVEHAQEMVDRAKAKGVHIYYAEDWLFAPAINRALELIDEGSIGELKYMRLREAHSGSHSPFAQKISLCGGGSMIHLGVHPVCFALAMKNNEWTEVVAMTSGGGDKNMIHKGMEGEDWATAIIRFKDGTAATLEGNYVTYGGMEDVLDFYGDTGCLHVDLTFSSALNGFSQKGFSYTVEKSETNVGWARPAVDEKYNVGYAAEIETFVDFCAKNVEANVGMRGEDGLEALKVINYIYQSAKEGRAVKNPNLEA